MRLSGRVYIGKAKTRSWVSRTPPPASESTVCRYSQRPELGRPSRRRSKMIKHEIKGDGVDYVTKSAYGKNLETNILNLVERIGSGAYRPKPKREVIPKDDAVFLFRKEDEAKAFLRDFKVRVESYGLSVNKDKSKTLSFRKTEHNQFDFLGFTFYRGKQGKRQILKVKTRKKSLHSVMKSFCHWIKTNRTRKRLPELWELAKSKIRGYYEYFGYRMNRQKLLHFYREVTKSLIKWLNRSRKRSYTWEGFNERMKHIPLGPPPKTDELKKIGWSFGHVYN